MWLGFASIATTSAARGRAQGDVIGHVAQGHSSGSHGSLVPRRPTGRLATAGRSWLAACRHLTAPFPSPVAGSSNQLARPQTGCRRSGGRPPDGSPLGTGHTNVRTKRSVRGGQQEVGPSRRRCAVRNFRTDASDSSRSARGVPACDFVAALGDENRAVARRRRVHTGAGEPLEVSDAGSSGAFGLLLRARGSVSRQESLRATPPARPA